MASIRDVAARAGVSTYTVSAVLNHSAYVSPELTSRVLAAVEELDYSINDLARGIFTGKTKSAGMLIPDIGSPFYAQVVRGVEDVLRKREYALMIGNTYDDSREETRYLAMLRSKRVDGVFVFAAPGSQAALRRWVEARMPLVFISRLPRGFEADSVTIDHRGGTHEAVKHLISKGHKRIAILVGSLDSSAAAERVQGWREALLSSDLEASEGLCMESDWTAKGGYEAGLRLLTGNRRPSAVFAGNFVMMTGVLRAIRELGLRCPRQVEVMSSDDSDWLDCIRPPISTVAQPSYELGRRAAQLLLERIRKPTSKFRSVVLHSSLRIR